MLRINKFFLLQFLLISLVPYDREWKEYFLIFLRFAYFPANFSQTLFQNINDSSLVCWIIQGIFGYLKNIATSEQVREDSRCELSDSLKERNKLHIPLQTPALSWATDVRTCVRICVLLVRSGNWNKRLRVWGGSIRCRRLLLLPETTGPLVITSPSLDL